jgi:hypothetical protein
LDSSAGAGIHDNLVTPGPIPEPLGLAHETFCSRNPWRIRPLSWRRTRRWGHLRRSKRLVLRRETNSTHLIPRVERKSARSMSPRTQERLSTVTICSSFRATASRRLIRTPAACSAQFLRPGEPVRDSRGAKARSGWGNIGTGRSIKSIPTQARFFAPSNPTALSRASHGSMGSSGIPLWKGTRAICGASILKPGRCWRQSKCHRG